MTRPSSAAPSREPLLHCLCEAAPKWLRGKCIGTRATLCRHGGCATQAWCDVTHANHGFVAP